MDIVSAIAALLLGVLLHAIDETYIKCEAIDTIAELLLSVL